MSIVEETIKNWDDILKGDSKKLVEIASEFGKYLAEGRDEREKLSTSQIRNVFSEVKQMKKYDPTKIELLRPKLAYVAGRHGKKVLDLQKVLDGGIIKINSEDKFFNFQKFFEATLAYHKYHGGK